jgi:ACS family glucarate transporter-like MFS transporter
MQTPSSARWLYIAPSLTLVWMLANMDKLGLSFFVTNHRFLADMGLVGNPVGVGLLFTGFLYAYSLSHFIWGPVVDRWGPRRAAVASCAIWGAMMLAGGLATSFGMMLAARLLLGVGEAALWPLSIRFTGTWFHPRERARAQISYLVGQFLGPAVAGILIIALLTSYGWRPAFFALGALSLLVMLPIFLFLVRDTPEQHRAANAAERQFLREGVEGYQSAARASGIVSFATMIRHWQVWMVVFLWMIDGILFQGLGAWIPSYLKFGRHVNGALLAGWTSALWIIAIGAAVLAAWLADRTRRPGLVGGVSFLVSAVAMYVGAVLPNPAVAVPFISFSMVGVAANSGLVPAMLQRHAAPHLLGRASALMNGVGELLSAFAPLFVGLLIRWNGGSYLAAILFLAAASVVGALGLGLLSREDARRSRLEVLPGTAAS